MKKPIIRSKSVSLSKDKPYFRRIGSPYLKL